MNRDSVAVKYLLYDSFRQPKGEEKLGRKSNAGIPHDMTATNPARRHPLVTPNSDVVFFAICPFAQTQPHSYLSLSSGLLLSERTSLSWNTSALTGLVTSFRWHYYSSIRCITFVQIMEQLKTYYITETLSTASPHFP